MELPKSKGTIPPIKYLKVSFLFFFFLFLIGIKNSKMDTDSHTKKKESKNILTVKLGRLSLTPVIQFSNSIT